MKLNGTVQERLKLRRIVFKSEQGKVYVFITNNFTLKATEIATLAGNSLSIGEERAFGKRQLGFNTKAK